MNALVRRYHALRCYVILAKDPGRLDVVFGLREALTDRERLAGVVAAMQDDPHYRAVLAERGYSPAEIDALVASGVALTEIRKA